VPLGYTDARIYTTSENTFRLSPTNIPVEDARRCVLLCSKATNSRLIYDNSTQQQNGLACTPVVSVLGTGIKYLLLS